MEKNIKNKNNKTIILGITGSVAAYKGCALASTLTQEGWHVIGILTQSACKFITPLSFQSVTGNPCYVDMFVHGSGHEWDINHISLADQASIVTVAPATADCIARCAHGRASDLLSSIILSTKAPVLIAPAMNVNMYSHPLTQQNIKTLKKIGYQFIGPEKGHLACGTEGMGRMSEPKDIITRINQII